LTVTLPTGPKAEDVLGWEVGHTDGPMLWGWELDVTVHSTCLNARMGGQLAMRIRWYGVERIAQHGRSRATLDATGRRHRVSIHPIPILPWRTPWPSIST